MSRGVGNNNPYRKYFFGDHNDITDDLRKVSVVQQSIDSAEAIRNAASRQFQPSILRERGPYRAQVLAAYDNTLGAPGSFYSYGYNDRGDDAPLVPFIVCRIEENHAMCANPADYDPAGGIQNKMESYNHLDAIKQHMEIGVFSPHIDDENYALPGKGENVEVDFSHTRGFREGKFRYRGSVARQRVGSVSGQSTSQAPAAAAGAIVFTEDMAPYPSPQAEPPIGPARYHAPFDQSQLESGILTVDVGSPWGKHRNDRTRIRRAHMGTDLYAKGEYAGIGTPTVTIGTARFYLKDPDSDKTGVWGYVKQHPELGVSRRHAIHGMRSGDGLKNITTHDDGNTLGTLLTEYNYESYRESLEIARRTTETEMRANPDVTEEQIAEWNEDYETLAPGSKPFGTEDVYVVNRDDKSLKGVEGMSQTNWSQSGRHLPIKFIYNRKPKIEGARAVNCTEEGGADVVINVNQDDRPEYGIFYPFTSATGRYIGNHVVYRLVGGPLNEEIARHQHLGAISPALVSVLQQAKDLGAEYVDIPKQQEIGLLGSTAIQDSHPHLHFDFGKDSPYDPGCYLQLIALRRTGSQDNLCCGEDDPNLDRSEFLGVAQGKYPNDEVTRNGNTRSMFCRIDEEGRVHVSYERS